MPIETQDDKWRWPSYLSFFAILAVLGTSCVYCPCIADGVNRFKSIWFLICIGLLCFCVAIPFLKGDHLVRMNKIDLLVATYLILILLNNIWRGSSIVSRINLETFGLLTFYFFSRTRVRNHGGLFELTLLFISAFQISVAVLQFFEFIPSYNNYFKITGFFDNPGPFAIYLAALMVACLAFSFFSTSMPRRTIGLTLFF